MSTEQLQCMVQCGMHVGSHGYDHYWLGSLPKEKQKFEVEKSFEFIKKINRGGVNDCFTICYPYGNYNDDTIALLKQYDCRLGFTTVVDIANIRPDSDERFKIHRLDTNDLPKEKYAKVNDWYYKTQ
jgi:peptidoglycan/xylan/chitin deacetylase (PgdA/CDA1 family)